MALTVILKPNESFVLNGTLVRNGSQRIKLHIETRCRILRESESIKQDEVDTPGKQIWMTLQIIHLSEDSSNARELLQSQMAELIEIMLSSAPFVIAIEEALQAGHTHNALKAVKQLVQHERKLLEQQNAQRHIASEGCANSITVKLP